MTPNYDTLVVVTPADYQRVKRLYGRLKQNLPGQLFFVGSRGVGEAAEEEGFGWINEDDLLPFDKVHVLMAERLAPILQGRELPRGVTGWYYQQFLKMQYALTCENEYYMVWDGDTIPCRSVRMFQEESGKPYFDLKTELHEGYFETLGRILPGMRKVIGRSFISEHMIFKTEFMRELIAEIEANKDLAGERFWEKILHAIPTERIQESDFSEFETYGTYCALRHMEEYALREWHSFRLAGEFFDPETIKERDFAWLGRDFDAISFEKGHTVREDHRNLFDNPAYQEKLSPRQMLESVQELFGGGYVEVWEKSAETGRAKPGKVDPGKERLKYLPEETYRIYERLGDGLQNKNIDQAYLCYENAAFLASDPTEIKRLEERKALMKARGAIVNKVSIVIPSYNNLYLLQKCIESIRINCCTEAYRLIVFDNASTDGTAEWLGSLEDDDILVVLCKENFGFGGGCNAGAGYSEPDEDVLFLNNDTRMPANALFWLRMGLYSAEDIGAVGSVQNYSSPDQLEDVSFDLPEQYMEYGAKHNVPLEFPYEEKPKISGFAYLVNGKVLNEVGGFDERFSPGYFEDDDLSFRIKEKGYCLLICHNSFIYHAGSQSFKKRSDLQDLFERNRRSIIGKWGFDSAAYATMSVEELKTIGKIRAKGFRSEDSFSLLYRGAGCGNLLGRLKYLYPHARMLGVEENGVARQLAITSVSIISPEEAEEVDNDSFDIVISRDRKTSEAEHILLDFRENREHRKGGDEMLTILMLVHNEAENARRAVEHLRESILPEDTQLILVDNYSSDGLDAWAKEQEDFSYVYMDQGTEAWGSVINQVIEAFSLDTDILIMQPRFCILLNGISEMIHDLHEFDDIGAVGCITTEASAYRQRIEKKIADITEAEAYAKEHVMAKSEYTMGLDSGLILFRREVIQKLGTFETQITSFYVQAKDAALRIGELGYRMRICRRAVAYEAVMELPEHIDTLQYIDQDNKVLEKKWGMHYFNLSGNYEIVRLVDAKEDVPISVMEIGCDCGATLFDIKQKFPGAKIFGCDIMKAPIRIASRFLDQAIVANIEEETLPFEKGSFDYVIFGDVLEHLHNPKRVLEYVRSFLKDGGKVIASVPNLMNITVMKQLLEGDFTYTETGLLDRTHIHFFTYNEILKLFREAGYEPEFCGNNVSGITEEDEELISKLLELGKNTERFMYEAFQYQIRAKKKVS